MIENYNRNIVDITQDTGSQNENLIEMKQQELSDIKNSIKSCKGKYEQLMAVNNTVFFYS